MSEPSLDTGIRARRAASLPPRLLVGQRAGPPRVPGIGREGLRGPRLAQERAAVLTSWGCEPVHHKSRAQRQRRRSRGPHSARQHRPFPVVLLRRSRECCRGPRSCSEPASGPPHPSAGSSHPTRGPPARSRAAVCVCVSPWCVGGICVCGVRAPTCVLDNIPTATWTVHNHSLCGVSRLQHVHATAHCPLRWRLRAHRPPASLSWPLFRLLQPSFAAGL